MDINLTLAKHTVTAFINTENTFVQSAKNVEAKNAIGSKYRKDHVSGYFHQYELNRITGEHDFVNKFTFQHCDLNKINMKEYETSFKALVTDHKNYYSKRFENVKFSHGNLVYKNAACQTHAVGAFIAIFDPTMIMIEARFHNGESFCFKGDAIEINGHNQRVNTHMPAYIPESKHPALTTEAKVHGSSKFTIQDLEDIHELLVIGSVKQKEIAKRFKVTPAKISQLKSKFKKEGKL